MRRFSGILVLFCIGGCGCAVDGTTAMPDPPDPGDLVATPAAAPWRGDLLAVERFADGRLEDRGWYDGPSGRYVDTPPPGRGEGRAFLCRFPVGSNRCADGTPSRLRFSPSDAIWIGYHVRYDDGWVGSGRPYHPHELYLLTTADDRWVGPANTHLTVYLEQNGGTPFVIFQDSRNVNPECILLNNDELVGCGGFRVQDFPFGENRSVSSCNGLVGDIDRRDCYRGAGGNWSSYRSWAAPRPVFSEPAPEGRDGWRQVEAVLVMNSIEDGIGIPDGKIRLWIDGELLISSDAILFRTGNHADMHFEHLLVSPWIGDGSPVDQSFRLAEIVIARVAEPAF